MKKNIMELFGLREVILDKMEVNEAVLLYVRSPRTSSRCPQCGTRTSRVHQTHRRKVRHDALNGRAVFLMLLVRRFLCLRCGKPFTEPQSAGVGRSRSTEHLKTEALSLLRQTSFDEVTKRYGVSFSSLLSFLSERKAKLPWQGGDIKLTVDEHSFSGRDLKITVGDAAHRELRDILTDDRKETLMRYLRAIPAPVQSRISEVCIDMKHSYKSAIEECLPHAHIVIDQFHVVKELTRRLDELRKILQPLAEKGHRRIDRYLLLKGKESLTKAEQRKNELVFRAYTRFPALHALYLVKEQVRDMYRCTKRADAERILSRILMQLEHGEVGVLAEVRDMLLRWKPYILNFFESRLTNAFIEGCHNRIKLIKRMSYGFRNFTNYSLKVTLAFLPFLFLLPPH